MAQVIQRQVIVIPATFRRVDAVADNIGFPPIDVYKVGDVYFVRDGNHRVSVARELEAPTIQAYVTEVRTKVPLSPDDQPDDLRRQPVVVRVDQVPAPTASARSCRCGFVCCCC